MDEKEVAVIDVLAYETVFCRRQILNDSEKIGRLD
jgi:hypothetical protein